MMSGGEIGFSKLTGPMQVLVLLFTLMAFIVPCVLGFVNFDKRLDIQEVTTTKHIEKDERKWENIEDDIDVLEDGQHQLELVDKELLIHYQEILRRLEKAELNDQRILDKLDTLEYAGE
jgi:hypothetical protein